MLKPFTSNAFTSQRILRALICGQKAEVRFEKGLGLRALMPQGFARHHNATGHEIPLGMKRRPTSSKARFA
ncbi:protein of unknown function [Bradyrhizobium vignae]|uniref:Uncharacterized protein n=1 Tax=Bradyrhizobium vignae TaxID=1549949 RepID=A0A2U3Q6S0_9BRAD|nr:protein of unknown function [Bradyrhizobium vignae]